MKMIKTTLLTDEEVMMALAQLRSRKHKEEMRHIDALHRIDNLVYKVQQRCSHNHTHYQWGQYMPCVDVCNICGMEIE